jgi:hypothetical protein
MVWATENVLENAAGEPWPQHERDAARNPVSTPPPPGQAPTLPLKYQIESRVPEYWIPFLPVSLDPANGVVALELASAMASVGHTPILPRGRVLHPTSIGTASPYQIPEEEVRPGTVYPMISGHSRMSGCLDGRIEPMTASPLRPGRRSAIWTFSWLRA